MGATTQQALRLRPQRFTATSAAGFGTAHLNHVVARGCAAKEVVVGDDAMHLGARQVHAFCDQGHGVGWNKAQGVLNGMQQGEQPPRLLLELGQELADQQEFRRDKRLVHKSIS